MKCFLREDIQELASSTRFPRLDNAHEFAEDVCVNKNNKRKDILKQCMLLHFEHRVVQAQRLGTVPQAEELASLPLFQQARDLDEKYLREKYKKTVYEKKEEEMRMIEEERLEEERRLERQREKEELKRKRAEAKELRRQERRAAKKEELIATYEEKKRRYEEAYEKWDRKMKEQRARLEELQDKIKAADGHKKQLEESMVSMEKQKESLLESLREAATKTVQREEQSMKKEMSTRPSASAGPGQSDLHRGDYESSRFVKKPYGHSNWRKDRENDSVMSPRASSGVLDDAPKSFGNPPRYRNDSQMTRDGSRSFPQSRDSYRSNPQPPPRRADDSRDRDYPRTSHSIRRGPPMSARYTGPRDSPPAERSRFKSYRSHRDDIDRHESQSRSYDRSYHHNKRPY